ncbi:hypothetical protein HZS_137 [Henneguya salminicola]|nr:hypothetical protein HZS_137 [Henneguya salminicola]
MKYRADRLFKLLKDFDTTVNEQNQTLECGFNNLLKQFERAHKLQLKNIPKNTLNMPVIEYLKIKEIKKPNPIINEADNKSTKYNLRTRVYLSKSCRLNKFP